MVGIAVADRAVLAVTTQMGYSASRGNGRGVVRKLHASRDAAVSKRINKRLQKLGEGIMGEYEAPSAHPREHHARSEMTQDRQTRSPGRWWW